jgi:hypothetical protein
MSFASAMLLHGYEQLEQPLSSAAYPQIAVLLAAEDRCKPYLCI